MSWAVAADGARLAWSMDGPSDAPVLILSNSLGTNLERFLSEAFRGEHPAETAEVGRMLEETNPAGYTACCAALRDADLRSLVPSIRLPCLVVAGVLD